MPDNNQASEPPEPPEHVDPAEGVTEESPPMVYTPLSSTLVLPGDAAGEEGLEADEEWVARPARGIRLALPVAGLLAVVLVAAGFWGGAALEKSHAGGSSGGGANAVAGLAARFRSARGGATTGTTGATGASGFSFPGGGFTSTSAASGTISVVDGNTLYVLTATGSLVKVTLSSSTTITRNADAASVDLRPGDSVVVQGTTSASGDVTASSLAATAPGVSSGAAGRFGGAAAASTTTTSSAG